MAAAALILPRYWKNRSPFNDFSEWVEPAEEVLDVMEAATFDTFRSVRTRGLKMRLESVHRFEDMELWRKYSMCKQVIKLKHANACTPLESVVKGELACDVAGTAMDGRLDKTLNEAYLFCGCSAQLLPKIAEDGMASLFMTAQFGCGLHLSESAAGGDMRTQEISSGPQRGLRCLLFCRVLLGEMLEMGEQRGNAVTDFVQQAIKSGDFEAVWGGARRSASQTDREARDFVVFDQAQVYPEYAVYYRCIKT
jgi:hypothetical protein